jgi:Na+-transporting methylmalonyl-CoA/oxaloacetate decarboxylase gamma subunit
MLYSWIVVMSLLFIVIAFVTCVGDKEQKATPIKQGKRSKV